MPVTVYPNVVLSALERSGGPLLLSGLVVALTLAIEKLSLSLLLDVVPFVVVEGRCGNDVYGELVVMVGVE